MGDTQTLPLGKFILNYQYAEFTDGFLQWM